MYHELRKRGTGGRFVHNEASAKRLQEDMKHVEGVIGMFDPACNLRPIALRRRQVRPVHRSKKRASNVRSGSITRTSLQRPYVRFRQLRTSRRICPGRLCAKCMARPRGARWSVELANVRAASMYQAS